MFKSRYRSPLCLIVAGILSYWCSVETTHAQSVPPVPAWNQFRGPNASGIAIDTGLPVNFDKNTNLLWSRRILPGASSPCIWGNRIFLSGFQAKTKKLFVGCLDRRTGKGLWLADIGAKEIEKFHKASTPASGTICTDGERVYAYFGSKGLLCYDIDGKPIWTIDMPLPGLRNGSGTSPIFAGNLVILSREGNEHSYLLAVDKVTGEEVWRYDHSLPPGTYNRCTATPVVWNDQVILHICSGISAFALSDGKPIWRVVSHTNGVATPVIWKNNLFVTTWRP